MKNQKRNSHISFAAIDFETATSQRDSACAVGYALFRDGQLTASGSHLICPPGNRYDGFNIAFHGIGPEDTADEPGFDQVWPAVADAIGGSIIVAHNASFDISVLARSAAYHGYTPPPVRFVCSYRLAKTTFPNRHSYRLDEISYDLGIDLLNHHDPLDDAVAAGQVMLALLDANEVNSVEALTDKFGFIVGALDGTRWSRHGKTAEPKRGTYKYQPPISALVPHAGDVLDEDHPLHGATVVFTGTLNTMSRIEAAQRAVNVGAKPRTSMSKSIDFLVVGETDYAVVGTDGMSTKLRRAVAIAESGAALEIISEQDFIRMISL